MDGASINKNLLKSQMTLRGVSVKDLANAQRWSLATASRKINGRTVFKAPEIQVCVELLNLNPATASAIFFTEQLS